MPNTPKRPDVEAIGGRADDIAHPVIRARSIADWAADIYALIAWIEALEAENERLKTVVEAYYRDAIPQDTHAN